MIERFGHFMAPKMFFYQSLILLLVLPRWSTGIYLYEYNFALDSRDMQVDEQSASGRIGATYNGDYGQMCGDYYFGHEEATVACKQLGYEEGSLQDLEVASTKVWLAQLGCSGHESNLLHCSHVVLNNTNCYFAASVRCSMFGFMWKWWYSVLIFFGILFGCITFCHCQKKYQESKTKTAATQRPQNQIRCSSAPASTSGAAARTSNSGQAPKSTQGPSRTTGSTSTPSGNQVAPLASDARSAVAGARGAPILLPPIENRPTLGAPVLPPAYTAWGAPVDSTPPPPTYSSLYPEHYENSTQNLPPVTNTNITE